jgi:hypothetical protein
MCRKQLPVLTSTLSIYYLCCIGEAKGVKEAGISFISLSFLVHLHYDLMVPCLNVTVNNFV